MRRKRYSEWFVRMKIAVRNRAIVCLCLLRFLFRGKSNVNVGTLKVILIVQLAKLGDMVCTTPMFRAVKNKLPESKIFVLGNAANQQLLEGNQDVDRYFVFEGKIIKTIKELRKLDIDFACVTGPDFLGLASCYLSGIKRVVAPVVTGGPCIFETKGYRLIRNFCIKKQIQAQTFIPREYLKLLEPIDIFSENTKKHLFFSKEAKAQAEYFLKNHGGLEGNLIVGIAPSAGNKLKIWGGQKFAQLIQMILSDYRAKIFILGAGDDKKFIDEIAVYLKDKTNVINTCDFFMLDQLKAFISKLDIFVGPDNGLIYVAESFNIPVIDIIGPADEREQRPVGEKSRIVFSAVSCRPCCSVLKGVRRCNNKIEPFVCFKKISPEQVFAEFQSLIYKK